MKPLPPNPALLPLAPTGHAMPASRLANVVACRLRTFALCLAVFSPTVFAPTVFSPSVAQATEAGDIAFFESKIRPVLVEKID